MFAWFHWLNLKVFFPLNFMEKRLIRIQDGLKEAFFNPVSRVRSWLLIQLGSWLECVQRWHIQHITLFRTLAPIPAVFCVGFHQEVENSNRQKKENGCRWVNLQWNLLSRPHHHSSASKFFWTGLIFTTCFLRPWHKTEPDAMDHKQKINMTIGKWKFTVLLPNSWFYVQMAAVSRKLMAFLGSISVLRRIKRDPALMRRDCFINITWEVLWKGVKTSKWKKKSQILAVNRGHSTSLAQAVV